MIKEAITMLFKKKDLSFNQTKEIFEEIFEHKATPAQIAAFLVLLRAKGEKEAEISAAASVVRAKAIKIKARSSFVGVEDKHECVMDTCGTGGSGAHKFNISTTVAFVVASSGIKVAKHGNRAMSSKCGSADVLEELGVKIDAPASVMEEAIQKIGVTFLYAPLYHPALKEVAMIRREMGVKTIFNILGPLCNPALADHQLLGVYNPDLVEVIARVLKNLGTKRALVVCGKDFKDEVSLTGPTKAAFLSKGKVKKMVIKPSDFGLKKISLKSVQVASKEENAKITKNIFAGKAGPCRDMVLANAACCFYVLGKAKTLKQGVKLAKSLLDSGAAKKKFEEFKDFVTLKTKS